MRIRLVLTALIAPAFTLFFGCAPSPSGPPARAVLVIAIDGLRFDHLGVGGYDRPTSPALDALAAEGVFFRQAYAAAPWQVPAHMALLSGGDPRLARRILPPDVIVNQATQWHLPDEAAHPAAQFLSGGFSTAMFYDHQNLAPVYGYQRGFELYQGPNVDDDDKSPDYGSEAVFGRFDAWLARIPQDKSWFAYLELADLERVWSDDLDPRWDTHFPPRPELSSVPPVGDAQHIFFALPRSRWSGGMATLGEYEARYDGAIAQLDFAFRKLRTHLERTGRFENTTVVIVGAYGMSFGESGLLLDSGTFADSDLHVPLIVRPASGMKIGELPARSGWKTDELVSTIDVLPTLLALSGLPPDGRADGVSFAGVLGGEGESARAYVQASCALQEGFAVIDRRYCFERIWPGCTPGWNGPNPDLRLSASWFGDNERHFDVMRELLHDRLSDRGLGHVRSSDSDPEVAKEMERIGELWSSKIEARRAKFQGLGSSAAGLGGQPSGDR